MQYVGRAIGSVSKTWNSINPATLSGAIDVIVVEQENGDLSCSPFHVRFGKFSLLRPSQKKVEFSINGRKTDLPMKLGEGGEAFFVFEANTDDVPQELLTSPVISPSNSPNADPSSPGSETTATGSLQDPEFLDLDISHSSALNRRAAKGSRPSSYVHNRSDSPQLERMQKLTKKLTDINIRSQINDNGDIVLDMTGYKADAQHAQDSEELVKKILAEEFGVEADIGSLYGADSEGNLRIFSGEDDDNIRSNSVSSGSAPPSPSLAPPLSPNMLPPSPGLGMESTTPSTSPSLNPATTIKTDSDIDLHHVKTLRLTSDQLKQLDLHKGVNEITFSVNQGRAVCTARMFYWTYDVPIVISDIDGTITKSDALGHVLTMLGRDWTHLGVGKLFSDIESNGYNIMYLTARSVGQADSTRSYLRTIDQNGYKLPDGPVILSPDRTIAAFRREVILRKPEIFKMACLRDIQSLFGADIDFNAFYAGFGNRITDAISYRSVGVPSSRIFTINSNSEVHMELLELAGYKSSYVHIADLVDHFFPPISESVRGKQELFTDVNFWREPLPDISDEEEEQEVEEEGEEEEEEEEEEQESMHESDYED